MAAGKTVKVVAGGISRWITPIVIAGIAVALAVLVRNLLKKYHLRNVGTLAGNADGSNLATDVYKLDSWLINDSDVEAVCKTLNALDNGRLVLVYEKFKQLYGAECPGGGITCEDTTSMKTFLQDINCIFSSCTEKQRIIDRLTSMGL